MKVVNTFGLTCYALCSSQKSYKEHFCQIIYSLDPSKNIVCILAEQYAHIFMIRLGEYIILYCCSCNMKFSDSQRLKCANSFLHIRLVSVCYLSMFFCKQKSPQKSDLSFGWRAGTFTSTPRNKQCFAKSI